MYIWNIRVWVWPHETRLPQTLCYPYPKCFIILAGSSIYHVHRLHCHVPDCMCLKKNHVITGWGFTVVGSQVGRLKPWHFKNSLLASILYIANCSRWKSFADRQDITNLLENFHGLFTPVHFNPTRNFVQVTCMLCSLCTCMFHVTCMDL